MIRPTHGACGKRRSSPKRIVFMALAALTVLQPAGSRAAPAEQLSEVCASRVRVFSTVRIEVRVVERVIEVHVTSLTGEPMSAEGSLSAVLAGEALRLRFVQLQIGILQATAPSVPTPGASAILHLGLPDGAKLQARLPLVQASECRQSPA